MSVCRFVSARITQKLHGRTSPNAFVHVACGRARSSSDGVAIRYVLPVLQITSSFHTIWPMGQNQAGRCLEQFSRWRYQLDVRQQCLVEFVKMRHQGQSLLSTIALFIQLRYGLRAARERYSNSLSYNDDRLSYLFKRLYKFAILNSFYLQHP